MEEDFAGHIGPVPASPAMGIERTGFRKASERIGIGMNASRSFPFLERWITSALREPSISEINPLGTCIQTAASVGTDQASKVRTKYPIIFERFFHQMFSFR